MPKTKVRPPRKPRGESAKVTIANQDRQIAMLIDRIDKLVIERDVALADGNSIFLEAEDLEAEFNEVRASYQRLLGWQDCAREMLARMPVL